MGILDAHGETLPFVDAVSGTLVVPWAGIQSGAEASGQLRNARLKSDSQS